MRHRVQAGLRKLILALVLAMPASAQTLTIAALGDSLTQGFGLAPEAGFTAQLQDALGARGHDVVIINAGVSGDTTAGGLSRIDWTLSDDPDALIVALGGNDALRGLPVEQARANLDEILRRARARDLPVLLVGITAPANFGPDYVEAFSTVFVDLARSHDTLLVPSFLQGLEALDDRPRVLRDYMQADGIHPNADGVALIVAEILPEVEELISLAR